MDWREVLIEGAGVTGWVEGDALRLICHNQGRGSAVLAANISESSQTQLSARYQDVELIVEGPRIDRFIARVEGVDDATVLMAVIGPASQPVRVTYKGRDATFEAKGDAGRREWPAAELHVTDERVASALSNRQFQPIDSGFGAPGHWLLDEGSLDQFTEVVHRRRAGKERGKEAQRQREAERAQAERRNELLDSHFVNPYTFVPLPAAGPARGSPPAHDLCTDDRPLVRIELTWTAVTPLATRTPYRHGDGRTGLAGSAVKGAVRSLHEALSGSCLRVVDLDAAPVHREHMQAGQGEDAEDPESWRRLARVVDIAGPNADGAWSVTLEVARRTVWVPSTELRLPVASGEQYDPSHIRGKVEHHRGLRRYQLAGDQEAGAALPEQDGVEWVPLVSHAGARRQDKGYHVPLGEFRREGAAGRQLTTVRSDSPIWKEYARAAADSRDEVDRRHQRETAPITVTWKHDGKPATIGTRQEVRSDLVGPDRIRPGHLLWATVDNNDITHLAAAYVWRRSARTSVRDRLPSAYWPCADPTALCPSCQVFGGGGSTSEETDEGHGYRGHVRVGPLLTPVTSNRVACAPLNAPRVGAGQFYLEPPSGRTRASKDETPLREWGSEADARGVRAPRGRKFYWPADPEAQREKREFTQPRWRAEQTPYQQSERGQDADVWEAGTELTQTITVIGLDSVRLGGLIAAIRPDLLAGPTGNDWSRAVVRMGYGKPLGLGVVRATRVAVTAHTPTSRYGSSAAPPRSVPDAECASWVADFAASLDSSVRETWADLRAATDPDHVWPEYVTYAVDRWSDYSHDGRPASSRPYRFTFWKQSAGGDKSDLVPLPAARNANQLLPLDPSKEREDR